MSRLREVVHRVTWGRAAIVTVVAVCVGYAPVAMTELWPYARPGAPAFGEWFLSKTVSPAYVAEALKTRIGPYGRSLVPMIVHSVLGGALMLLGPLQLLSAVRRRPRLHRWSGIAFAVTVYVSMAGAGTYLARTAPQDAFSGSAFWIILATILVGTVLSVTFGILAAVGRFPGLHQRWMLLCYGYLMTAPLLRFEWGGLPLLMPGLSMEDVNRVAIMHLGSVVVFGSLLASRAWDRRRGPRTIAEGTRTWAPWPVLAVAHVVAAAALAWVVGDHLERGAQGVRLLTAYLVPYAVAYAVMVLRLRGAGREGRTWAREEWGLHLACLCLAPAFSVGAAVLFERSMGLDHATAVSAGVSIGCGVLAFAATILVSLRVMYERELAKRALAPTASGVVESPSSHPVQASHPVQVEASTPAAARITDGEPVRG
ncbi:DUF2306 domain-containing protein [Streptomyces sp. NPDC001941]|uniref:DUF2306 domain-containing protein n=1 Tax=Streptomyces sp. NPDC001941 TaxID=3154659 RepID=UPI00332ABE4F